MNIKDFETREAKSWREIFDLQTEVNRQFAPDFKETADNFDISYHDDQEYFKKYCWCVTEELMEVIEAVELNEPNHVNEELIDAMNFTIQLITLYGWGWDDVESEPLRSFSSLRDGILTTIYDLGLAANCLKNRSWRESQYLVDLYVFEPRLRRVWGDIISVIRSQGVSDEEVRKLWDLKYQVNRFRLETRY